MAQPPPPTGGRGAYMANLQPIPSIVALDKPGVKIWDLIGTNLPPKMNDGTEMCLSYHLRKGCWSNCRRASHHDKALADPEVQHLAQYITQRMAMVTPSTSTPAPSGTPSVQSWWCGKDPLVGSSSDPPPSIYSDVGDTRLTSTNNSVNLVLWSEHQTTSTRNIFENPWRRFLFTRNKITNCRTLRFRNRQVMSWFGINDSILANKKMKKVMNILTLLFVNLVH